MIRVAFAVLLAMGVCLIAAGVTPRAIRPQDAPPPAEAAPVRFGWIDVFVDSGDRPLAAYQIELTCTRGDAAVVGIEGGDPAPFRDPPYYDPAAMMRSRVILAALSTADAASLPTGRARLARVHLRIAGEADPVFTAAVHAASGPDGEGVPIIVEPKLEERK